MKKISLQRMTVTQLVERFLALALDQDKALLSEQISKVNRLYDLLHEVEAELKARDGDQRRALLNLYDHPNPQVRVKAANATLAVAPEPARQALKSILQARENPQTLEAGSMIWALEEGIYKPT